MTSSITPTMIEALYTDLASAGLRRQDIRVVLGSLTNVWGAELDRLRRIEAAAHEVLTSGQARYHAEELHAGDLVPATAMAALREAVGSGEACPACRMPVTHHKMSCGYRAQQPVRLDAVEVRS